MPTFYTQANTDAGHGGRFLYYQGPFGTSVNYSITTPHPISAYRAHSSWTTYVGPTYGVVTFQKDYIHKGFTRFEVSGIAQSTLITSAELKLRTTTVSNSGSKVIVNVSNYSNPAAPTSGKYVYSPLNPVGNSTSTLTTGVPYTKSIDVTN